MDSIIVGPIIGEWGWMLCTFIPHARHRAKEFKKVIAIVPPGEEYLVRDFATDYETCHKPDRSDRWLIKRGKIIKIPKVIMSKYPGAAWFPPSQRSCTNRHKEFIQYGQEVEELKYDIVIHARATKKYNQENRNYDPKYFKFIVNKLGLKACSVGVQAHHIEGTDDRRNVDVETLANIMRSSKVVVGPSSGPMHLASLCKTPHVVFSGKERDRAIKGTNRDRYKRIWSPFRTPCTILDQDSWNPHPNLVIEAIEKYL